MKESASIGIAHRAEKAVQMLLYAHRQIWKAHSLWQWPDDIALVFVRFGLCSSTHRRLLQCVDFDSIAPQMLGPVQRGIREADEAAKFGGFVA